MAHGLLLISRKCCEDHHLGILRGLQEAATCCSRELACPSHALQRLHCLRANLLPASHVLLPESHLPSAWGFQNVTGTAPRRAQPRDQDRMSPHLPAILKCLKTVISQSTHNWLLGQEGNHDRPSVMAPGKPRWESQPRRLRKVSSHACLFLFPY